MFFANSAGSVLCPSATLPVLFLSDPNTTVCINTTIPINTLPVCCCRQILESSHRLIPWSNLKSHFSMLSSEIFFSYTKALEKCSLGRSRWFRSGIPALSLAPSIEPVSKQRERERGREENSPSTTNPRVYLSDFIVQLFPPLCFLPFPFPFLQSFSPGCSPAPSAPYPAASTTPGLGF